MHQQITEQSKTFTPVSFYNMVIKQYNDPVNVQNGVLLEKAYQNSLYRFWFNIQKTHRVSLVLMYFMPYLNFFTVFCNLLLVVIHELAIIKFHQNRSKVLDPLENMIYDPSLCTRSKYIYYEVDRSELSVFNLSRESYTKILKLKENENSKIVRFMAYNRDFLACYYSVLENRIQCILHLLISSLLLMLVYYFLYSHNGCFALLRPFQSIQKCILSPPNPKLP